MCPTAMKLECLWILFYTFHAMARDSEPPTYYRDVAPILNAHCIACHQKGQVAPFTLTSASDSEKHARQIAVVVRKKVMPPWKPEPGFGDFGKPRGLSEREITILETWAATGATRGVKPYKNDEAPASHEPDWALGPPDIVAWMPEEFTIPSEGEDLYHCFVVPLNLIEDRYLIACDIRPGNNSVLHHALLSKDETGEALKKDLADPGPGFRGSGAGTGLSAGFGSVIGVWTPGTMPQKLPPGVGLKIEKNSVLVLQNHYHPTGKVEHDRTCVALYFSETHPRQLAKYTAVYRNNFEIPAGDARHLVTKHETLNVEYSVLAVMPHMHLLGKEMRVSAFSPEGVKTPMIWIKNWDFRWQDQYFFAKPLELRAGSTIFVEAWFDNSAQNPMNPNSPPVRVREGPKSTDEMASVVMLAVAHIQPPVSRARILMWVLLSFAFAVGVIVLIRTVLARRRKRSLKSPSLSASLIRA